MKSNKTYRRKFARLIESVRNDIAAGVLHNGRVEDNDHAGIHSLSIPETMRLDVSVRGIDGGYTPVRVREVRCLSVPDAREVTLVSMDTGEEHPLSECIPADALDVHETVRRICKGI